MKVWKNDEHLLDTLLLDTWTLHFSTSNSSGTAEIGLSYWIFTEAFLQYQKVTVFKPPPERTRDQEVGRWSEVKKVSSQLYAFFTTEAMDSS